MMGWHCQFKKNKSPLIFAGPETRVETLICGNFPELDVKPAKKKNTLSPALTQESSKLSGSRRTEIEFLGFHVPWWKVARKHGSPGLSSSCPLEPGTYVTTQPACLLSQTPPPALSPPVRLGMCISGDEWLPGGDLLLALNSGPPRIFHSAPLYLIWHFLQPPAKDAGRNR